MLSRPPFPIGTRGIGRAIQLRPLPLMCEHRKGGFDSDWAVINRFFQVMRKWKVAVS